MQKAGEGLDRKTSGAWVQEELTDVLREAANSPPSALILDAVRIAGQIEAVRRSYGRRVLHIHLTAPPEVLEARYKARRPEGFREFDSYAEVLNNPTEAKVNDLMGLADVVIDSKQCTEPDVVVRAACHAGLYATKIQRVVDVLVGGQYGSEGKGQIAAHLSPEYDVLVRVGGPNAGHSVKLDDGRKVKFHHLPSGSQKGDMHLIIGPGAVLNPDGLLKEIAQAEIEVDRLSIDPQAMVIDKRDIRAETKAGGARDRIASTGQGVGASTIDRRIGQVGAMGTVA